MFSIHFSKANAKFCFSLHYIHNNSYLFVNGKEIFKFNANNKNFSFSTQFCLRTTSIGFGAIDSRKASLKGNAYDVSVDYDAIDKFEIFNDITFTNI